ncbi:hypothetical protein KUH03_13695 [Sphingobacterium sp. E70]|uniref:hypothetical protein n=1 Tax=Sphingobacterium sp. E70 TaxID=2853439 RepID=UPI00211CE8A4|nr:hypothetical protein [Sphingobacterium sp. E70]ULT27661.1 hypothetical protein KUH03_13695 [Sphingobacterium sp. E70]
MADYGRAHKVAAWAVLSKMYLYKKDYKNATLYADMVINQGKRGLEKSFTDVFKAANNWGPEYIWSVTSTPAGTDGWGSILPGVMLTNGAWGLYNGWGYYMPTKELYDSYEAGDVRREATILKPGISLCSLVASGYLHRQVRRLVICSSTNIWSLSRIRLRSVLM